MPATVESRWLPWPCPRRGLVRIGLSPAAQESVARREGLYSSRSMSRDISSASSVSSWTESRSGPRERSSSGSTSRSFSPDSRSNRSLPAPRSAN